MGPAGEPTTFYTAERSETLSPGETSSSGFLAVCDRDPGDTVTGGGFRIEGFGAATHSAPNGGNAWLLSVTIPPEFFGGTGGLVTVYAVCAHSAP